ncbi:class I SAM-dependent methyltransferase [Roseivivax sp.]
MAASRLSHALTSGALSLPDAGVIALFNARGDSDLAALPEARLVAIERHYPEVAALRARGIATAPAPEGPVAAALVFLPRARAEAEALLAEALAATDGPVIVDGQKTDGIDTMLKAVKARAEVRGVTAKAHGKCFEIAPGADLSDWRAGAPAPNADGFLTLPGVFSADGIDPASRLLAAHLPETLTGRAADLGAGWGYLSSELARREGLTELHLVEADAHALNCARGNLDDPRARFHWADARDWRDAAPFDLVVCNPPFHSGRAADPALGRAFIAAAARLLAPSGRLYLVANRQLPYETTLEQYFARVESLGGDARFKLFVAQRPTRRPRT